MSKTDKKNKENKENLEKTDIINIANYNQDFSYKNVSSYQLESFYVTNQTLNGKELNKSNHIDYFKNVLASEENTEYENIDNKENTEYKNLDNEEVLEEFLKYLVDEGDIENDITKSLNDIDTFIQANGNIIDLIDLDNIYIKAKKDMNIVKQRINDNMSDLEYLNDNFVRNFIIQECISAFVEILSGKLSTMLLKSNKKLAFLIGIVLNMGKSIPLAGWIFLAIDLGLSIYSLYLKRKRFIGRENAFNLGKEYIKIEALFNKMTSEIGYVYLNGQINRDIFDLEKYDTYNIISMYIYKDKIDILNDIKELYVRNSLTIFKPSFKVGKDVNFNIIHELEHNNHYCINSDNHMVQLSSYDNVENISSSSYYNHINSLIFQSQHINLIRTNNFSSIPIYTMINKSYNTDNGNINKYTIIFTNKINKENINSLAQKLVMDKLSGVNNTIIFRSQHKYNYNTFNIKYIEKVNYITNRFHYIMDKYFDKMYSVSDYVKHQYNYMINYIILGNISDKYKADSVFYYSDRRYYPYIKYHTCMFFKLKHKLKNFYYKYYCENYDEYDYNLFEPIDISSISEICQTYYTRAESIKLNASELNIDNQDYSIYQLDYRINKLKQEIEQVESRNSINKLGLKDDMNEKCDILKCELEVLELIQYIYQFIIDLQSISGHFYPILHNEDLQDNLETVKENYCDVIDNFFKKMTEKEEKTFKEDKIPYEHIKLIKQDNSLRNILIQIITVLYNKEYVTEKEKLLQMLDGYIAQYVFIDDHLKELEDMLNESIKECDNSINTLQEKLLKHSSIKEYNHIIYDKDYYKKIFYELIYDELSIILPVSKSTFSFVCDDEKYYRKICEIIVYKSYKSFFKEININQYIYSKLMDDQYNVQIETYAIVQKIMFVICTFLFGADFILESSADINTDTDTDTDNNNVNNDECIDLNFDYILETIIYEIVKNDIDLSNLTDENYTLQIEIAKHVTNDKFIFNVITALISGLSLCSLSITKYVKLSYYIEKILFNNISKNIKELPKNIKELPKNIKELPKNIKFSIRVLRNNASTISKDKIMSSISFNLMNIKNKSILGLITSINSIKSFVSKQMSIFKKIIHQPVKNIYAMNEKVIRDNKNNNKNKLFKNAFNVGINYFLAMHLYDNKLRILNPKEYEIQLMAIKYAFISKRENTPGAEWNASKGYFTLPLSISQNFIMSDFRAMVVGGAHFDNSCFIKGTSSGIFVQDNEKVTRSFLEIILDYIDVVEEQQLDVKMGKYLVAYYKVINYLYEFHNYYSMSLDKLKILYDNLSRIEEFINSKNLIQKKKGADNENILNINNNNSQTIDNSLMKDFVIQLKRIGESNYKFYETQKPGKEGQASNNNDNSKGGDVQEAQPVQDNSTVTATATATATATTESDNNSNVKFGDYKSSEKGDDEMPVLLGSLIYDESWFKSTIDDE